MMTRKGEQEFFQGGEYMPKCNQEIRMTMMIYDVKQWELAESLGMAEATLSRKLRTELSPELKEKMIDLIKKIGARNERGI